MEPHIECRTQACNHYIREGTRTHLASLLLSFASAPQLLVDRSFTRNLPSSAEASGELGIFGRFRRATPYRKVSLQSPEVTVDQASGVSRLSVEERGLLPSTRPPAQPTSGRAWATGANQVRAAFSNDTETLSSCHTAPKCHRHGPGAGDTSVNTSRPQTLLPGTS